MLKTFAVTCFIVLLSGCGTFRGSGGYHGVSKSDYKGPDFKAPSDYSNGVDSSDQTDKGEMRDKMGHQGYTPRYPFRLQWPVQHVQINRGFHSPRDRKHEGVDFGGKRGLPIFAAHEGVVIYAGHHFRGYGRMVLLEYDKEWATLYAHLDKVMVHEGEYLAAGDQLGTMGATGNATGVHLHFEVMHFQEPVDPIPLLTGQNKIARQVRRSKNRVTR